MFLLFCFLLEQFSAESDVEYWEDGNLREDVEGLVGIVIVNVLLGDFGVNAVAKVVVGPCVNTRLAPELDAEVA
jgi:hypothetical protein